MKVSPLAVLQLEKRERSMAEGLDEEIVKLEGEVSRPAVGGGRGGDGSLRSGLQEYTYSFVVLQYKCVPMVPGITLLIL